jgi:hypothetical protein
MPRKKSKVNATIEVTEVDIVTNNVTEQSEPMTSVMLDLSNLQRHQHIMNQIYGDMSLPSAKVNALDAESTFSFDPNGYVDPEVLEFNAAVQAKKRARLATSNCTSSTQKTALIKVQPLYNCFDPSTGKPISGQLGNAPKYDTLQADGEDDWAYIPQDDGPVKLDYGEHIPIYGKDILERDKYGLFGQPKPILNASMQKTRLDSAIASQTKDLQKFLANAPHPNLTVDEIIEKGTYNGRTLRSYADAYQDYSEPVFTTGKDKARLALRTKFFKVYYTYQRAYNIKGWVYPDQANEFFRDLAATTQLTASSIPNMVSTNDKCVLKLRTINIDDQVHFGVNTSVELVKLSSISLSAIYNSNSSVAHDSLFAVRIINENSSSKHCTMLVMGQS